MNQLSELDKLIYKQGVLVKNKTSTWNNSSLLIFEQTGIRLTKEAIRKRFGRIINNIELGKLEPIDAISIEEPNQRAEQPFPETIEHTEKGSVVEKVIELTDEEKQDQYTVLAKLGWNKDNWTIKKFRLSNWQQHTKEQTTKNLYAVRMELEPTIKLDPEKYTKLVVEALQNGIEPIALPKKRKTLSNKDKLIEIPAIELHLGKLGWSGETGQNYDYKIASERFNHIINEICERQDYEQAEECVYYVGNDFFNSDNEANTTTRGTPQHNDVRWQKMFEIGLNLQLNALTTLREKFNKVNVRLCAGNHDHQTSYFLYMALMQAFKTDDILSFSDNKKDTQVFVWGDCAIFTNHGDVNLKRLITSIPAEFYKEWGQSKHRELHLGHLHKEVVVDDNGGLITRRVGSPSGTDYWHYKERFIGATQKSQYFIWDKKQGLLNQSYITFEELSGKKKLIKTKTR